MGKDLVFAAAPLLALAAAAPAQWDPARPDAHAPAGVVADHTLPEGAWSFSYDYRTTTLSKVLEGASEVSTAHVLRSFPVAPLRMSSETHSVGVEYGAWDRVSLRADMPWERRSLVSVTAAGQKLRYRSEGLGDARVWALPEVYRGESTRLHLNAGVSLPTGNVSERDDTPLGPNRRHPYPLQLGSGTTDLLPGATLRHQMGDFSLGLQALGTIRLGHNHNDYTVGSAGELTAWGAYRVTSAVSASVRLDGRFWEDVDGADPAMQPRVEPTADPNLQGGRRADALFGLNLYAPGGLLGQSRVTAEFGFPVFQDLDGPQVATSWTFFVGLELAFGGPSGPAEVM